MQIFFLVTQTFYIPYDVLTSLGNWKHFNLEIIIWNRTNCYLFIIARHMFTYIKKDTFVSTTLVQTQMFKLTGPKFNGSKINKQVNITQIRCITKSTVECMWFRHVMCKQTNKDGTIKHPNIYQNLINNMI